MIALAMNSTWTPTRVARLIEMIERGDSAGVISKALGGTTRNAVIGKGMRMGFRFGGAGLPSAPGARLKAPPRPRQPAPIRVTATRTYPLSKAATPPPRPRTVTSVCEPVGLLERTGCKYAVNDGEHPTLGFLFCNAERDGPTYCGAHARLCSGGLPEKRQRRAA